MRHDRSCIANGWWNHANPAKSDKKRNPEK
jgi:hypothetical protein